MARPPTAQPTTAGLLRRLTQSPPGVADRAGSAQPGPAADDQRDAHQQQRHPPEGEPGDVAARVRKLTGLRRGIGRVRLPGSRGSSIGADEPSTSTDTVASEQSPSGSQIS